MRNNYNRFLFPVIVVVEMDTLVQCSLCFKAGELIIYIESVLETSLVLGKAWCTLSLNFEMGKMNILSL